MPLASFKRRRENRRMLAAKKEKRWKANAKAEIERIGKEIPELIKKMNAAPDWTAKERFALKIDRLNTQRSFLRKKLKEWK
jgi:uncharacterized protein (DUF4415 family)